MVKKVKQSDLLRHLGIEANSPDYQKVMRLKKSNPQWFNELMRLAEVGLSVEIMVGKYERKEH